MPNYKDMMESSLEAGKGSFGNFSEVENWIFDKISFEESTADYSVSDLEQSFAWKGYKSNQIPYL